MSCSSLRAVSITIGAPLSRRISRQTSNPSSDGSITSSTTRSTPPSRKRASPSRPSPIAITFRPACSRPSVATSRIEASSSTSSTCSSTPQMYAGALDGPSGADAPEVARPVAIRLSRVARLLRCGHAVLLGELGHGVVQRLVRPARADHQDRAGPVARADADVARAGREVDEVPGLQPPLLLLDEQQALTGEHEEVLLHALRVIEAVHLAGMEDVDADPVLLELAFRVPEVHPLAALVVPHPGHVGGIQDEPARGRDDRALVGLLDRR